MALPGKIPQWGKISCLTLREPIGNALQLIGRLTWLQPQCVNAC